MKKIILVFLIGLLGVLIATLSYGASRLSEKQACEMAKAQCTKEEMGFIGFENRTFVDFKIKGCTGFSSISDRGVAEITVSYSFYNTVQKISYTTNVHYNFRRTDQGWKIIPRPGY